MAMGGLKTTADGPRGIAGGKCKGRGQRAPQVRAAAGRRSARAGRSCGWRPARLAINKSRVPCLGRGGGGGVQLGWPVNLHVCAWPR